MRYKICEYYGSIFQPLNTEYIILSKTGISFSSEFREILNLKYKRKEKSIEIIENLVLEEKAILLRNDEFLFVEDLASKLKGTGRALGVVDMIWDENNSKVNPFEYNHLYIWYSGASHITSFSISHNVINREIEIRNNKIENILK